MQVAPDETGKAVVPILACVLNQLCARNDKIPFSPENVSKFHALRPPAISIRDYLERIYKYASCSGECFVMALVYIDRIIQLNPQFVVNSLNIHRLLVASIMLAAKFFDDHYFNNAYYAKVGGVPCDEVNSLEVEFLFMTNFALFVTTETYSQYYTELANHARNGNCSCYEVQVPPLVIPPALQGPMVPQPQQPIQQPQQQQQQQQQQQLQHHQQQHHHQQPQQHPSQQPAMPTYHPQQHQQQRGYPQQQVPVQQQYPMAGPGPGFGYPQVAPAYAPQQYAAPMYMPHGGAGPVPPPPPGYGSGGPVYDPRYSRRDGGPGDQDEAMTDAS